MHLTNPIRLSSMLQAVTVVVLATAGALGGAEAVSSNLVANPSFEEITPDGSLPANWSGDRNVYTVSRETVRTGEAALKFVNDDPKRYRLASQKIALRPGWKYRIRVWVKTEDLRGEESGATVCVEWRDPQGKWLGGVYPSGAKGTRDWTRIEAVTRLPEEARDPTLSCYVRQGMTGTAWFDDVEVVRLADPPLKTMLLSPVYRGRITPKGPQQVRVHVGLNLVDCELPSDQLSIATQLTDKSGRPVDWEGRPAREPSSQSGLFQDRTESVLEFPAGKLPVGEYALTVRLLGPEGKELQSVRHRLARMADDFQPTCTIDEHRRLLVHGKPFFPLGMYFSSIQADDLKTFADSKFNCLMPYGSPNRQQMDLAEQHGLKVIYSIKDWYYGSHYCPKDIRSVDDEEPKIRERVRAYRDHPALLAWYLNDELPQSFLPQLNAHQRFVEQEDPDHPTWVVLYQYREVGDYTQSFDVIGTDPYPIGRAPASGAAGWTAETLRQVRGARPLWQVPQIFNWANYRKDSPKSDQLRTPTYDEMRSMAWQCITEGATGLVFYSWYDIHRNSDVPFPTQWDRLKKIAEEIDRQSPVLLSVERVPALKVAGETGGTEAPSWLHWTARVHEGKLYLFVVNDGDGAGKFTVALPGAPKSVQATGGRRSLKIDAAGFQDDLAALELQVYAVEL